MMKCWKLWMQRLKKLYCKLLAITCRTISTGQETAAHREQVLEVGATDEEKELYEPQVHQESSSVACDSNPCNVLHMKQVSDPVNFEEQNADLF
jgi:hypothetical protein